MENNKMKVGIVGQGGVMKKMFRDAAIVSSTIPVNFEGDFETILKYEESKLILTSLSPDLAQRIIKIVEEESDDISRRLAFLDTTIEEIKAGADYSKVETIKDIAHVYSKSLIDRLGIFD